jgi:hypothetical protein
VSAAPDPSPRRGAEAAPGPPAAGWCGPRVSVSCPPCFPVRDGRTPGAGGLASREAGPRDTGRRSHGGNIPRLP